MLPVRSCQAVFPEWLHDLPSHLLLHMGPYCQCLGRWAAESAHWAVRPCHLVEQSLNVAKVNRQVGATQERPVQPWRSLRTDNAHTRLKRGSIYLQQQEGERGHKRRSLRCVVPRSQILSARTRVV